MDLIKFKERVWQATTSLLLATALSTFLLQPAHAQNYPTGSRGEVAKGGVNLQCNVGATACTPPTTANPVPVAVVSGGGGGTGTSAQQAQGNVASGAADSGNPVKVGGKFNVTIPILTDGQRGDTQTNAFGDIRTQIVGWASSLADGVAQTGAFATSATSSNVIGARLPFVTTALVFNGTTLDRARGDTRGTYVVPGGLAFANITTAATTVVKSGAGVLHTLTVNNLGTVASSTVVYDNTAASGTKIATINTLAGQTSYIYDVAFTTGLTIVTTGTVAPDITVSYR